MPEVNQGPSLTCAGRAVILLFVLASLVGAYMLWMAKANSNSSGGGGGTVSGSSSSSGGTGGGGGEIEIGIAYGTEKRVWLEWAVKQWQQTDADKRIVINLKPMGSLEGAQALLNGDKSINVWSPASSIYKDSFVQDWNVKYGGDPIAKEDALALTPMVFVMWQERYDAFVSKYKTVDFKTIGDALQEKGGWSSIAQKPDWGVFKFGHTHPNESNSGLATLLLMAAEYHNNARGLTMKELLDTNFQTWMQGIERAANNQSNSTGNLMKEMVLKGPSSFDALFVYESVVIDFLKGAEGRWGSLKVVYPDKNMWNESPYYIIDAPWSSKEQRKAAAEFLEFMLSDAVQQQSLVHGFRPANTNVSIKGVDSPFTLYRKFGLSIDLKTIVEPPKAEVINNLLQSWQRGQAGR